MGHDRTQYRGFGDSTRHAMEGHESFVMDDTDGDDQTVMADMLDTRSGSYGV